MVAPAGSNLRPWFRTAALSAEHGASAHRIALAESIAHRPDARRWWHGIRDLTSAIRARSSREQQFPAFSAIYHHRPMDDHQAVTELCSPVFMSPERRSATNSPDRSPAPEAAMQCALPVGTVKARHRDQFGSGFAHRSKIPGSANRTDVMPRDRPAAAHYMPPPADRRQIRASFAGRQTTRTNPLFLAPDDFPRWIDHEAR